MYFSLLSDRPTDKALDSVKEELAELKKPSPSPTPVAPSTSLIYSNESSKDFGESSSEGRKWIEASGIEFCYKLSPYPFSRVFRSYM